MQIITCVMILIRICIYKCGSFIGAANTAAAINNDFSGMHMLRKTPLTAAIMSVAAFPAVLPLYAFAQNAPATESADTPSLPAVHVTAQATTSADFQPEKSSVGAKVPAALRDIPQGVVVVPKAVLQSQAATSFSDALRNVPGVTIGAAEGGSIGNNINLRGFTARTDIYLDGFRDRGQYYRDTFDLESIDVLYGPSSLYFGRGSTGGVINQVSKQAGLTPHASVSAMAGTSDRYRTSFDIDQPLSSTSAVRLNAFGQDLGSTRDIMKSKDYGFAPTATFGIGTPTQITLSALIQHNRDQPDYGVPSVNGAPAKVDKGQFYGFVGDRTIQDVQTVSARIQHKFDDNLTLRNETQFSHYGTDARATNAAAVLTGPSATSTALANGNFTSLPLSSLYVKLQGKDRVINDHSVYNTTDIDYKFQHRPAQA